MKVIVKKLLRSEAIGNIPQGIVVVVRHGNRFSCWLTTNAYSTEYPDSVGLVQLSSGKFEYFPVVMEVERATDAELRVTSVSLLED